MTRWLTLLMALGLLAAAPVAAQVEDGDLDNDGVADEVDFCEETPEGDFVDGEGCSICPCDETYDGDEWASHDEFVSCVIAEAKLRKKARMITRKQKRAAVKRAKRSSCGNDELTRCCVYGDHLDYDADPVIGECRVMSPDACFELGDDVYTEDAGSGGCTPNPCTW
jgi:hypothetical protein